MYLDLVNETWAFITEGFGQQYVTPQGFFFVWPETGVACSVDYSLNFANYTQKYAQLLNTDAFVQVTKSVKILDIPFPVDFQAFNYYTGEVRDSGAGGNQYLSTVIKADYNTGFIHQYSITSTTGDGETGPAFAITKATSFNNFTSFVSGPANISLVPPPACFSTSPPPVSYQALYYPGGYNYILSS